MGACAATWDPGTTGPLWYFSQGVTTDTGGTALPGFFSVTADAGDFDNKGSYWVIFPHPNARGITGISSGVKFSQVEIDPFLYIERKVEQSAGRGKENPFIISVLDFDLTKNQLPAAPVLPSDTYKSSR